MDSLTYYRTRLNELVKRIPRRAINGSIPDAVAFKAWVPKAQKAVKGRATEQQLSSLIAEWEALDKGATS